MSRSNLIDRIEALERAVEELIKLGLLSSIYAPAGSADPAVARRNRKAAYMARWNYVKDNIERAKANPDAFADELKSSGMFCQTSARIDCRGSVREMIRRIELELGPRYLPHS